MAIVNAKTDIILEKSGPKRGDYNPDNKTWAESVIGNYTSEILSEPTFKVKITGNYDASKAPYDSGGGDALHSFESRIVDSFGGKMSTITNGILNSIYNEKKINPKISSLKITITGKVVNWEIIIQESDDGKAYVGLTSRGGAGNNDWRERAQKQIEDKKKDIKTTDESTEFADVLDYVNSSEKIRQIFVQFTKPKQSPYLPKSTSDTKTDQEKKDEEEQKKRAEEEKKRDPKSITSKVTLKKKSGPGELVGVVELTSNNGYVEFKGLQFSEPGDYVISVIPESNELQTTEIQIKVESGEVIEQDPSGQDEPTSGNRPIIAQIDPPTYSLPIIQFDQTNNTDDTNKIASGVGDLPFLWFGGYQISPEYIKSLFLFYDEFVPKIATTFQDPTGLMNSPQTAPTSNATIELFLNSKSENLKFIHLRFLIDQKKDNKDGTITIYGKLDLKEFYKLKSISLKGSSFDVLRKVSTELGLGFNSNINETNDTMVWVRSNSNVETYFRDIITKSYISDESFMVGYIDYYYCFNYVDVEKEYNRDTSKDIAINSTGLGSLSSEPEERRTGPLILTNDKAANSSPFFFRDFKIMNNATTQLTTEGATTDSKSYDRKNKRFNIFRVDSLTSLNDKLKTLRSKDDIETNNRTEMSGKIDVDNAHENFLYAQTQNKRNLINLTNIMASLVLPTPNFNIYKFQKVRVVYVNEKTTITEPDNVQVRNTGDWIIIDISYSYQKSELVQNLIIARKELTKTDDEIQQPTEQDQSQNNEVNENQAEPTTAPPNSLYYVGQELRIDQGDNTYLFVVDNVADNGIEISGRILRLLSAKPPPPPEKKEEDKDNDGVDDNKDNDYEDENTGDNSVDGVEVPSENKNAGKQITSYDQALKSGFIGDVLYKVISNKGSSKKYTDVLALDGGTIGVAHFAVGGLAILYDNMDTQKYFGKDKETMKNKYSSSCRPEGKEGNDTGWGCFSQSWWKSGFQKFVASPESESIQNKVWGKKMKDLIETCIKNGWTTERKLAIALGIANSKGTGGFKTLASNNGWDAEKTITSYAQKSNHTKKRKGLIDQYFPI